MVLGSDRKKQWNSVWKELGFMTQGRREVEVGTNFLGNDKINVIIDKILSYF